MPSVSSFEHLTVVKSIDVVPATRAPTLRVVGRVANAEDVHVERHAQVPADAGEVACQLDAIAEGGAEEGAHGRHQHTEGSGGMIED